MRKRLEHQKLITTLRLAPGLHSQLQWQSTINRRSLNSEIIMRLEKSLVEEKSPSPFLEEIHAKLSELDDFLREREKQIRLAAERIEQLYEFIEEKGLSESKPPESPELDLKPPERRIKNPTN